MSDSVLIVAGVDFSSASEIAAAQGLAVARHLGGELLLLHARAVVELPPRDECEAGAPDNQRREVRARELAAARDELGRLRERLSGQGAPVSQLLVEGHADDALCAAASELRARLTVVGAQGQTGLRWLQLGSVAQRVVRQSETDVLVARRLRRASYDRIVVATDFSASAERALEGAIALAAPGAEIEVVHHLEDEREDLARTKGEQLLARMRAPGLALTFHVSTERPVPGILHWLEARPGDLLSVGSHGRRGIRRLLLGSVAEAVVRHAPVSVLVAHGLPRSAR